MTIKEGDVDIGAPQRRVATNSVAFQANRSPLFTTPGANASAENPGEDEAEDGAQTVDVIQHSFRLNETSFDKKVCRGSRLNTYMKRKTDPRFVSVGLPRSPQVVHEDPQGGPPEEGGRWR